jgi:hypothetical protein
VSDSSPASNKDRSFLKNIALSDSRKRQKRRNGTRTNAGTKVGTAARCIIHPQFRKKVAQRRGAMTTRSFVPMLNAFTEQAKSRPKQTGTKVGTVRRARFAATRLERTEERNRALVIRLESLSGRGPYKTYSDTTPLFGPFERRGLIDTVRAATASRHPLTTAFLSKYVPLGAL